MMQKENKKMFGIVAFLLSLIPRLLFLTEVYPMSVAGDESFMFMPAATWAGLDWSGIAGRYRYYGYGFVALLTPLFKIIDNPVLLYRIIVGFMILFQAIVAPVSYHIMKKYFDMKDSAITMLLSVCCSYLVFLRAVYAYNEFIYDLVVWLIFWCLLELCKSYENKKRKVFYTGILMLLLIYAMTIHSRAVTLWIALSIAVIFMFWVYRKCLVSIPVVLLFGTLGYVASQKGIQAIVKMFTETVSKEVGNTAVSFSIESIFQSEKAGIAWFYTVLGQMDSMAIVTGGVAVLAAVIACRILWRALFRKKEIIIHREETQNYVLIFVYGLAASGITIAGQGFSWLSGVLWTIENSQSADAMRAVTYLRYYGVYFVPVLMVSIVWCYKHQEKIKENLFATGIVTILLQIFWTVFILPYIDDFNGTSWDSNPFSFTRGWEDLIHKKTYLPAVIVTVVFLCVFCMLLLKRKYMTSLILFVVLLFYSYSFNCIYHEGERGKINYSYVEESYRIFQKLEETQKPDEIYVEDISVAETGQPLVNEYQFILKNEKIMAGIPETSAQNTLFITADPRGKEVLSENGFLCAQIDKNAYWYVKGKGLQEAVKKAGVFLKKDMENKSRIPFNKVLSDVEYPGNGFAYMDSNGNPGNFLYGYVIPSLEKNLRFEMEILVKGWTSEEIGSFQLWDGTELLSEKQIHLADMDEDGMIHLEYEVENCKAENIEPRIYLNQGNYIRLLNISYESKR